MKKLFTTIAVLIASIAVITAQSAQGIKSKGVNVSGVSWAQSIWTAPGNATLTYGSAWTSGNEAVIEGTAGVISVPAAGETASSIVFNVNKSVVNNLGIAGYPGGGTLTLTNPAGSGDSIVMLVGTNEIDAPIYAEDSVVIVGTASGDVLNLDSLDQGNVISSNIFLGNIVIPAGLPLSGGESIRINSNSSNVWGGSAVDPTNLFIDATGVIMTNVGSMTNGNLSNILYTNLHLNRTGLGNATTPYVVAVGGTKPNTGVTPLPLNWNGVISSPAGTYTDVVIENAIPLEGGGTAGGGGSGWTTFSNSNNTYSGKTIFASGSGIFTAGATNCLPQSTRFVFGDGSGTYGLVDLAGFSVTVGSIETNGATAASAGLSNSSGTAATLTIAGGSANGATPNLHATWSAVPIGGSTAVTIGSVTRAGTANMALTMNSTGGFLDLRSVNAYTGATTVSAGTLLLDTINVITAASTITVSSGATIGGNGNSQGPLVLNSGGILEPGQTVSGTPAYGYFATWGNQTWNSGSVYDLDVTNITSGFSHDSSGGTVAFSGTTTLNLAGTSTGFSNSQSYSWTIITANSITGFNAGNWTINTSGDFATANLNGGTFAVSQVGNTIVLTYTCNVCAASASVSISASPQTGGPGVGSEGANSVYTITVTLSSAPTSYPATVNYTLSGTNVTSARFEGSPSLTGTISIASGLTGTNTTTYEAYNDDINEGLTTGTVTISSPSANIPNGINTATATFEIQDSVAYFWNGGNLSNLHGPAQGGTGDFGTANAWIAPNNTASDNQANWANGYYAYFGGAAGTVTLDSLATTDGPANRIANLFTFTTSGYTLVNAGQSTPDTLNGPLLISTGTLNVNPNAEYGGTLQVGPVSGPGTLNLIGTTGGTNKIQMQGGTYSAPITITGSGTGNVDFEGQSGVTNTLTGGISNSSGYTLNIWGGSGGGILNLNGAMSGSGNVWFGTAPGGGGNGTVNFNVTNPSFTGTIGINGNVSSGHFHLNVAQPFPTTTNISFPNSGAGGIVDVLGNDLSIGTLNAVSGSGGYFTNGGASGYNTITINQATNANYYLGFDKGANADLAVVKDGAGNLTLTGVAASTFTHGLTINDGGIIINTTTANILGTTLPITLNGGTLGITAASSQQFGTLTLSSSSTIALGTAGSSLHFANSSSVSWTGTLYITGWSGTVSSGPGSTGQLFVGSGGLSSGQLAEIQFAGYAPGATITGSGEVVPTAAISQIYSVASGDAFNDNIWSLTSNGTGENIQALIGGFSSSVSIEIQNGDVVTDSLSTTGGTLNVNNLTIDNGGSLVGGAVTNTIYEVDVFGNVNVNGSLGENGGNGRDGIALDMDGASPTIQSTGSTGTIDLQRIKKSTITPNATTSLTIATNVNLWNNGTDLYSSANNSTFNVTVNSGVTVNFNGTGDLSTDGGSGSSSNELNGTITINGTLSGIRTLFANSENTAGTVGIAISSGGSVTAKDIQMHLGGQAGLTFTVASGANLYVDSVLELMAPYEETGSAFAPAGTVTLVSTSVTQAAYIDNFSGASHTGTYSGNITAQRYYGPASAALDFSQHMLGVPVGGLTAASLGASGSGAQYEAKTGGIHNCDELAGQTGTPYGNVFNFIEANASSCVMDGWYVTAASTSLAAGTGYSVVLGTSSGTLSLSGAPNLAAYYAPATTNSGYANTTSDQGNVYPSGINLISNPYPAALRVDSLIAENALTFNNTVYVWDVASGMYTTPNYIAPFQAFKVIQSSEVVGSNNYYIGGTARTTKASSATFQRTSSPIALNMTITNNSTNLTDETTVGFNPNATSGFDIAYDLIKLPGATTRHTLYSVNNNNWMWVNTLKSISETSSVPVGFEPGVSGTYTVTFAGINSFDPTTYVILEDLQTGTMHDVRSGSYTFTANATDNFSRFVLHFTPAATINTTNATCSSEGMINVTQPGTASWNYTVVDANNATLSSGTLNANSPLNTTVPAGVYTLTLVDANGYTVVKSLQVNGATPVIAGFTPAATAVVNNEVTFTSNSQNATSNVWNFGDGTTATGDVTSHAFASAGVYSVALTSSSDEGCSATASHTINVTSRSVTGIQNLDENAIKIWSYDNLVNVSFGKAGDGTTVAIYNVLGQQLVNDKLSGTGTLYSKAINNIEAGYVIVTVKNDEQTITSKVFINNIK